MEHDEMAQELFSRMDNQAMQAEDLFLLGSGFVRRKGPSPRSPSWKTREDLTRLMPKLFTNWPVSMQG